MTETQALLEAYVRRSSEGAFRQLVERYLGLVFRAALRVVDGDAHLAEDVAQTVFTDLARQAANLSDQVMLGGSSSPRSPGRISTSAWPWCSTDASAPPR